MTEVEIIARAQMYLEKLAKGIDPLTGEEVSESDIINNVRISRCLSYVSDILKKITETGSFEVIKNDFSLTPEQRRRFEYSQYPLSVSEITERLNGLINPVQTSTLKMGVISDWMTHIGMLTEVIINSKKRKRVTAAGRDIGIFSEKKVNQRGVTYEAILYDTNAQHFIIDNIDAIIEFNTGKL